jgi:hypothetical protein
MGESPAAPLAVIKRRPQETGLEESPLKKLKTEPARKRQPARKVQEQKPVPEWMQDSLFAYSEEEEEGKVAAKAKRRPASKRKMPKVQLGKSPKKRGKVSLCFYFLFLVFMIFLFIRK